MEERMWTGSVQARVDEVQKRVPRDERVVVVEDFNGHVEEGNRGDNVMDVRKREYDFGRVGAGRFSKNDGNDSGKCICQDGEARGDV
ncbi:hypothetical protein SK128_003031 [Halocaridina rubra]|uniref:Uncharacterized protein n=1 Tax=Halocaridina rubra TaxID=373956 RepID=A0AAN9A501_HALRR